MSRNVQPDPSRGQNRVRHGKRFAKRVSVSQAEPPPREAVVTNDTAILRGSLRPTGY